MPRDRGDEKRITPAPFDAAAIAPRLLAWYAGAGRELPWRNSRDPYRIWLSEIMLQQTSVATVIPYYQRFLARFPTLEALAATSLDEVITLWAGLGYYSRVRNLHRAARMLDHELNGDFPATLEGLMALPGVGRSTAGAILCIAFDQPAPILDGNVRRVLVRLFAWSEDPRSSRAERQLWGWASALTPAERPHDYAQAIMDLGATVCTPRQPICGDCPLRELCQAHCQGVAAQLPSRPKKAPPPVRRQLALAVSNGAGLLLRQRPLEGFLGGLWELPCTELAAGFAPERVAGRLLADLALHGRLRGAGVVKHAYSHFKLELTLFVAEVESAGKIAEPTGYRWCHGDEVARLPLHGAHRKACALSGLPA